MIFQRPRFLVGPTVGAHRMLTSTCMPSCKRGLRRPSLGGNDCTPPAVTRPQVYDRDDCCLSGCVTNPGLSAREFHFSIARELVMPHEVLVVLSLPFHPPFTPQTTEWRSRNIMSEDDDAVLEVYKVGEGSCRPCQARSPY